WRRVGVAGSIGGPYLEAVAAGRERAVTLRTRTGRERPAIELALERAAHLRRREAEAGARAVGDGRRHGRERGIGRCGVDGPGEAGRRRIGVTGGIDRSHLEGVSARRERAITL